MADTSKFDIRQNVLVRFFGDSKTAIIPEGVTEIGAMAFMGRKKLTSVIIPSSVTKIGERAFDECERLSEIVIPNGVTELPSSAFRFCKRLTEITLPEGLRTVGDAAFYCCERLSDIEIPETTVLLGSYSFTNCKSLRSLRLPKGLSTIGHYAFAGCEALTSADIPDSVTRLGRGVFNTCTALSRAKLPKGLSEIPEATFKGCSTLENVDLGDGITRIGSLAFYMCSSLSELELPKTVERLEDRALYNSSIKTLRLGEGIRHIGANAVPRDVGYVYVPNADCEIHRDAFEKGTAFFIPAHLSHIPEKLLTNAMVGYTVALDDGYIPDRSTDVDYFRLWREPSRAYPHNLDGTFPYFARQIVKYLASKGLITLVQADYLLKHYEKNAEIVSIVVDYKANVLGGNDVEDLLL